MVERVVDGDTVDVSAERHDHAGPPVEHRHTGDRGPGPARAVSRAGGVGVPDVLLPAGTASVSSTTRSAPTSTTALSRLSSPPTASWSTPRSRGRASPKQRSWRPTTGSTLRSSRPGTRRWPPERPVLRRRRLHRSGTGPRRDGGDRRLPAVDAQATATDLDATAAPARRRSGTGPRAAAGLGRRPARGRVDRAASDGARAPDRLVDRGPGEGAAGRARRPHRSLVRPGTRGDAARPRRSDARPRPGSARSRRAGASGARTAGRGAGCGEGREGGCRASEAGREEAGHLGVRRRLRRPRRLHRPAVLHAWREDLASLLTVGLAHTVISTPGGAQGLARSPALPNPADSRRSEYALHVLRHRHGAAARADPAVHRPARVAGVRGDGCRAPSRPHRAPGAGMNTMGRVDAVPGRVRRATNLIGPQPGRFLDDAVHEAGDQHRRQQHRQPDGVPQVGGPSERLREVLPRQPDTSNSGSGAARPTPPRRSAAR